MRTRTATVQDAAAVAEIGLHDSLAPDRCYVLLVAAVNTRAISFYERHGLRVRDSVDGVEYYRTHMGVDIGAGAPPYPAHIMQRQVR